MEFSMALSRSPANMETEGGEKLQLMLRFEASRGGESHSVYFLLVNASSPAMRNGRSDLEPRVP